MDITDIKVVDANGDAVEGFNDIVFQKIEGNGDYSVDVYGWAPDFGGWNLDFEETEAGTVTFSIGEAICVNNDSGETVYFSVAGQVDLVNKNKVNAGFALWGNSTPVTVDIKDVAVVDAEGNELESFNDVVFQKLESNGDYSVDVYGWSPDFGGWNLDFEPIEEGTVTLAPGEAVCVNNDSGEAVYMKLPSPIKK